MRKNLFTPFLLLLLVGCASSIPPRTEHAGGKTVCDTYLILSMCVQDVSGDDTVDMIYFTDTNEIFMYQEGRRSAVAKFMPFHRCAVPLNEGMQATTNRILNRSDLSLGEEIEITRLLISNYIAARPAIDACNEKFEEEGDEGAAESEFSEFESEWDDEL
ncbi:MAG: hypothetical protein V7696_07410 [Halioglobus sp.]